MFLLLLVSVVGLPTVPREGGRGEADRVHGGMSHLINTDATYHFSSCVQSDSWQSSKFLLIPGFNSCPENIDLKYAGASGRNFDSSAIALAGLVSMASYNYSIPNCSLPLIPILRPLIRSGVRTPASRGCRPNGGEV